MGAVEAEGAGVVARLIDIAHGVGAGVHEDRVLADVGDSTRWRVDGGRRRRRRLRARPALEHSGRVHVLDALATTDVERHIEDTGGGLSRRAEANPKLTPTIAGDDEA